MTPAQKAERTRKYRARARKAARTRAERKAMYRRRALEAAHTRFINNPNQDKKLTPALLHDLVGDNWHGDE